MPAPIPLPRLDALLCGAHRLSVLTDEALFAATGVRVAFTSRAGGISVGPYASLNTASHVGDDLAAAEENRRRALDAIGAAGAPLIVPNQVHGAHIARVRENVERGQALSPVSAGRQEGDVRDGEEVAMQAEVARVQAEVAEGADAVIVEPAGVAALLNFADCLPLVIVSPSGRFAVVHAGWRGAVAHIASKAAVQLAADDSHDPAQFNAYIGPHIRAECFEVGEEVAGAFADEFGEGVLADPRHVSLAAAVTADLASAGLARERIVDAGICTVCHADEYFSYRATGGACGRHAALAWRSGCAARPH